MKAILLIDHGSRRAEANEMMDCMANLVQAMAGPDVVVRCAHMELAEPTIAAGVRSCVDAGATELIVFPYMLSPGKHSTGDIPRMVTLAAAPYPSLDVRVTSAFGVHEKLAELILGRAGVSVAHALTPAEAARCWHSSRSGNACGDACRCYPVIGDEKQDLRFAQDDQGEEQVLRFAQDDKGEKQVLRFAQDDKALR